MNKQLEGGGPVYPVPGDGASVFVEGTDGKESRYVHLNGISLRDHMAIEAMKELIPIHFTIAAKNVASMSYAMADAMLAAREVAP